MKNKMQLVLEVSITSRQIAELTGKNHADVMRDIRVMFEGLGIDGLGQSKFADTYTDVQNKKRPMYVLDKKMAVCLISGYDVKLRMQMIEYIEQLEREIERLKQERIEHDKIRLLTKIECRELTDAVQRIRLEQGKVTQHYHYSNEFDLINRIVLGMTAKQYRTLHNIDNETLIRDCVNKVELDAIQTLQKLNAALYEVGMNYEMRQMLLSNRFKQIKLLKGDTNNAN